MWRGLPARRLWQCINRLVVFGFCVFGVGKAFFKDRDPADDHDQAAADQSAEKHDRNEPSGKYRQREAHVRAKTFLKLLKSEHSQDFEANTSIEKPGEPCQSYQGIVVFLDSAFYIANTDSYIHMACGSVSLLV